MTPRRPHLAGVGAAIVLALVMAGDRSARAESAAPAGIGAKPKEPVKEPLMCGDCSAIICRECGTPLELVDELGIG